MPKVSIVIPTYNHELSVGKSLDSILEQTYQDFEIIIIDDGSTDQTRKILKPYLSERVHYFHQSNQGPGAARNRGIERAKGDYIAFNDSDDLWRPEKLKQQVEILDKDLNVSFLYSDLTYYFKNVLKNKKYFSDLGFYKYVYSDDVFHELMDKFFVYGSTVLLRAEVFKKAGVFNEEFYVGEDWDLWLRILKHYPIHFMEEPLIIRYVAEENLSMNQKKYHSNLIKLKEKYFKDESFLNPVQKRMMAHQIKAHYYDLGYEYMCSGHKKKSLRCFQQSVFSRFWVKSILYSLVNVSPDFLTTNLRKMKRSLKEAPQ